ncbi:MAG TPA: hypothetical protein VER58_13415 [Thermoanaerobaculia bacterium]|nr:hypothetical protein [Thermoanaerobaculia bacterium]
MTVRKNICAISLSVALLAPVARANNAACDVVQKHAQSLTALLEAKLPAGDRKLAASAKSSKDFSRFAAGAMLQGQFLTAAWASLKAADLEWTPTNITNAAVALLYDGRLAESGQLLGCAAALAPGSPFVLEARAMLAFRLRDCPTATSLIEEAARLMPDDMNVHYSAGVVEYRCGHRPQAALQLDQAQDIAPSDKTVDRARHVVEGPAADKKKPPKNPPLKLIDECRRFMQQTLERGELVGRENMQFESILGSHATESELRELRRYVAQQQRLIDTTVEATQRSAGSLPAVGLWNAALDVCIHAYLGATRRYANLWRSSGTHVEVILADAMGLSPVTLAQRHTPAVNGTYLVQENIRNFVETAHDAVAQKKSCDEACPLKPGKVLKVCRAHCQEEFCARVLPAWKECQQRVQTNMELAASGFEGAAASWLNDRIALQYQAKDYMLRALKEFRAPDKSVLEYWVSREREDFGREMQKGVMAQAYKEIRIADQALNRDWRNAEAIVENRPTTVGRGVTGGKCASAGKAPTLEDAIDRLIAAAEQATEFDAHLKFDCEGELGPVKVSFNPTSMDEAKVNVKGPWGSASASLSSDKISVKIEAEGASASASVDPDGKVTVTTGASAGPVSAAGTCDAGGCRVGASASHSIYHDEQEASVDIVHAKVETSVWTEIDSSGNANALAQCTVSGGFGEKFGKVGVACDVVEASAKFDLRAFCGALATP